jgi:hypothetical protein
MTQIYLRAGKGNPRGPRADSAHQFIGETNKVTHKARARPMCPLWLYLPSPQSSCPASQPATTLDSAPQPPPTQPVTAHRWVPVRHGAACQGRAGKIRGPVRNSKRGPYLTR